MFHIVSKYGWTVEVNCQEIKINNNPKCPANLNDQCFQAGHVCGDDRDLINGRPTGSVRISFGYMSTLRDAKHCLKFIVENFLETANPKPAFTEKWDEVQFEDKFENSYEVKVGMKSNELKDSVTMDTDNRGPECTNIGLYCMSQMATTVSPCLDNVIILTNVCLYPVKSCAAFMVSRFLCTSH